LVLTVLPGLPLARPGDDLPALILVGLARAGIALVDSNVLVIAQKAVSTAQGWLLRLADVTPSAWHGCWRW
jgi:coenzyme F420-0:L-glutamate ligase/coenzyme F420-1:gamma-L-glutamate ligase